MTALILILVSAVVHAVVNVLTKRGDDKYAMRLLIGVFSAVIVAPALFFLPLPQGQAIHFLIATAIVHALYEWLLVRSYESAAFSAVYPVARGTGPLFTALGVILVFGQQPPAANWGLMINENRIGMELNPWSVVVPAALIALLTIGTNTFTDAVARVTLGVERRPEEAVLTDDLGLGRAS